MILPVFAPAMFWWW